VTLDRHTLDGVPQIKSKTLTATAFEQLMTTAGYSQMGSASAQSNRIKIWWTHDTFRRVESIYSANKKIVITAYHP
jgi:hypothetical protein